MTKVEIGIMKNGIKTWITPAFLLDSPNPEDIQVGDKITHRFDKQDYEVIEIKSNEPEIKSNEPETEEDKILKPYRFEIEETYREEGQRAGDRLVASLLRQEGFEPTSPSEQESARQAIENERAAKGRDDGE